MRWLLAAQADQVDHALGRSGMRLHERKTRLRHALITRCIVQQRQRRRHRLRCIGNLHRRACGNSSSARAELHAEITKALQLHVKGLLAPYEYPKEIEFVDALPMTTTGKVQRRVLRLQEQARARGEGEPQA